MKPMTTDCRQLIPRTWDDGRESFSRQAGGNGSVPAGTRGLFKLSRAAQG
jgi:hypothetical protein